MVVHASLHQVIIGKLKYNTTLLYLWDLVEYGKEMLLEVSKIARHLREW
jgi:membrane-associated PAP2 superfamily phosphatase